MVWANEKLIGADKDHSLIELLGAGGGIGTGRVIGVVSGNVPALLCVPGVAAARPW